MSLTSYLRENEAENLLKSSILLQFLTLGLDIWRTMWRLKVSDGSCFFFHFSALSFELNLFFDRSFPLIIVSFDFYGNSKKALSGKILGSWNFRI